jgi:ribonuclease HII
MNKVNESSPASKTSDVERVVIRLEELRPHMTIVWAFNRFHVADAMAKMLGGKRASYDSAASRILAKARKDGTIKPARKDYDRYYFFADV